MWGEGRRAKLLSYLSPNRPKVLQFHLKLFALAATAAMRVVGGQGGQHHFKLGTAAVYFS